jgi:hypothetical protein
VNVAGLSLGGGRRENFFFCLLEHYPERGRWFLKSLHQMKDEEIQDRDEIIPAWATLYQLKEMIVDFPLSRPLCETCVPDCQGARLCPRGPVNEVRDEMAALIDEDERLCLENPKKYEQERLAAEEINWSRDLLHKTADQHVLSRAFKRKLRKGFVPYWHRPIDFWIWKNYYDQLLSVFKTSYDSYGHVSVMLLARMKHLQGHFPVELHLFETSSDLVLLELYRAGLIGKHLLLNLFDLDLQASARETILRSIEQKLQLFVYDNDFDMLVKNPKAFDSFLLAVAGQRLLMKNLRPIPDWGNADGGNFFVPDFRAQG